MDDSPFVLEVGKESDAEELYHIHTSAIKQVCASHYGAREVEIWAGKQNVQTYIPFLNNKEIIVAKEKGAVVGFIHHFEKDVDGSNVPGLLPRAVQIQIKGLFVHPNSIRRGLGKLLVEKVQMLAEEKAASCLKVSASLNSVSFYKKMGFHEVERGAHPITCQCSVECVSMIKNLES